MSDDRGGRPRDAQLDRVILEATRALLGVVSYSELSMEAVAVSAQVSKKTLYRRWPSKAPLVADAVLEAYGLGGSFGVPDTGDIRADLESWLVEHSEFIAKPSSAALIRALVAAAASNPSDNAALYERLSAPQHAGLTVRLRSAVQQRELRADADLDAIANALIGTVLLELLNRTDTSELRRSRYVGLLEAVLHGVSNDPHQGGGGDPSR